MRLIDADRLIRPEILDKYYHLPNGDTAIPIIDIKNAPTVDAVPLDKLCEWLAKYIGFPCNYSPIDEEMADYCGDQCEMDDIGCWEKVLSKWMEEQDATD